MRSRQRVVDHGEVFTPDWLVEAMLDMVEDESRRIDSRFFEPACGSGNFLVQVLGRKLATVALHGGSDEARRRLALRALMSVYGVELLADNVADCRQHLLTLVDEFLGIGEDDDAHLVAVEVLRHNIVHGNVSTMLDADGAPITLPAWVRVEDGRFRRVDVRLDTLTQRTDVVADERPLPLDVVVGNPPYQLARGSGGSSDSSIYHHFVRQAITLDPRFVVMVVPSRWLAGGRGLHEFRTTMLGSHQLATLVDHPVSKEVFPGVEVKGGVCYFLWSRSHRGPCEVTVVRGDQATSSTRQLDEFDVFVRDLRAVAILRKVLAHDEPPMTDLLTADTPFGVATNFDGHHAQQGAGDISLYYVRSGRRDVGFVARASIRKNAPLLDTWKVLVPKASSDGGQRIPDAVLGKPWLCAPPSAATQSFLAFCVGSEDEAMSVESYYRTKFFRLLVSLRKITQDALKPMYSWVPQQRWDQLWSDAELYAKYDLTQEEIDYVEAVIRPMDPAAVVADRWSRPSTARGALGRCVTPQPE